MNEQDPVKVTVYLDDQAEPIGEYRPPATFELDTRQLPDGPHRLLIKATERSGAQGVREVRFTVRNGPGIAVVGLANGDIVEGRIPVLINAYAGTHEENWEPRRAETPAPIPTWSWLLFLIIVAWAMFYWAVAWGPSDEYAGSPTFSAPTEIAAAALEEQEGRVAATGAGDFAWEELGRQVYEQSCQRCHGLTGEGVAGFVPTLKGSTMVMADDLGPYLRLLFRGSAAPAGAGTEWRPDMPAFSNELADEEMAAVVNFTRANWENDAVPIAPAVVRDARSAAGNEGAL
ncbi:MAG: c-type cytochrome [Terriglobia bacterium]